MRTVVVCLALFGFSTLAHSEPVDFKLERGPHGVGFRVLQQYDHGRVYKTRFDLITGQRVLGERARPVQTLIWYPTSQKGAGMAYSEYLRTAASEEDFSLSAQEIDKRAAGWIEDRSGKMDKELLRQELKGTTWAVRDAAPAPGKFPVVLYAPSLGAPAHENVELAEFLASQGYVVMASASVGTRSRGMTTDLEGLETQAADIRFLLASAYTLPQVDTAHIGVIGYSWGGLANIYAAARDDRIGALVSLDGSVRSYPKFANSAADGAKYVTPERVAVPLLFVGARPKSVEQLNSDGAELGFSFMNGMKYSDVYVATMAPMIHADFSSYALRLIPHDPAGAYTRQEVLAAHAWTIRYVHQFLDAYLKASVPAFAFMQKSATENGSPRHMMTLDIRPAKSSPATFENLTLELNTKGYELAIDVYKKMQKNDPKFQVSERSMDDWGYALFNAGRRKEAMEVFRLGVSVYPQSGALFDSLAEMYEHSGDKKRAMTYYRRSLELDPDNGNAVRHLKKLQSSK